MLLPQFSLHQSTKRAVELGEGGRGVCHGQIACKRVSFWEIRRTNGKSSGPLKARTRSAQFNLPNDAVQCVPICDVCSESTFDLFISPRSPPDGFPFQGTDAIPKDIVVAERCTKCGTVLCFARNSPYIDQSISGMLLRIWLTPPFSPGVLDRS